jgi:sucrose phosphorylase
MLHSLGELYPRREREVLSRLLALLEEYPSSPHRPAASFSARDAILISYADMLHGGGEPPLDLLAAFCERRLAGRFSHLHILPFFPSSSDEGFSVLDYTSVDPRFGGWAQIARIGRSLGLAFDLVLNHASAQGAWFREFLRGSEPYRRFFITRPRGFDGSKVFRPRIHPLLSTFRREDGTEVQAWTTFSPDQVDLDFTEPEVLLAMVGIALSYVARGAAILRLDAIAFAWKEDATNCLDLPQVHSLVRLFRAILDEVAPGVSLLSETNLPKAINDSYFGKGDEAHLVYNFSLPPLALHAFVSGSAGFLSSWAAGLAPPEAGRSYVNFLSSHDGIGLAPVQGYLPAEGIDALLAATRQGGGLVSERSTPGGQVPYELNTTFLDAIAGPGSSDEARARAFLSCHGLMASLAGLPAIYFHSLVGSRNWPEGPATTGSKRSINRQRLDYATLERELDDPETLRSRIFTGLASLLSARARRRALDPASPQLVLEPGGSGLPLAEGRVLDGPLFALLRGSGSEALLAVVNISDSPATCVLPRDFLPRGSPFDPTREGKGIADGQPSLSGELLLVPPRTAAWTDGSMKGA